MNAGKILMVVAVMAVSSCAMAKEPDRVLVFNAEHQNVTCLQLEEDAPISQPAVPPAPPKFWPPRCPGAPVKRNFLSQGERTELRVYNRKFFSDYSITVDFVTTLVGPKIRNLEEAEGLTLGSQAFITPPPAKGGAQGIPVLTSGDFLLMLLDESRSGDALRELRTEEQQIKDRAAQLQNDFVAFQQKYIAIIGNLPKPAGQFAGAPDVVTLLQEFQAAQTAANAAPFAAAPYSDEHEFERLVTRAEDLLRAVKTLGKIIDNSAIVAQGQQLESSVAEYRTWVLSYQQNLGAANGAAYIVSTARDPQSPPAAASRKLAEELSLQRLKNLILQSAPDPKQVDTAQLNEVLNSYRQFLRSQSSSLVANAADLHHVIAIHELERFNTDLFYADLSAMRTHLADDLPGGIIAVNAAEGALLSRINEIYNHSEVQEALPKPLDLSGHSGNLIVYFTIRRVEGFKRYEVNQLLAPVGQGQPGGSQVVTLPPAAGNKAAAAQPAPAPAGDNGQQPPAVDQTPGVVVARGQLQVHDFYYANVTAAFAFSKVQDVSILKQPATSTSCTTPNCFTPIEGRRTEQLNLILGVDYYLKPRDTYPGVDHHSGRNLLQSFGIMGAISATHANNWFLGPFWEPITGAQFAVGANFGSERRLQKPFTLNTPFDMSGDFPTDDKRVTKLFFSAGMDLALFRKIFGKITGVGGGAKPVGNQ